MAPELGQHARFDIATLGGQVDEYEGVVGGFGHFPGVIDFLEGVDLVEEAGLLEGGELGEALLAVGFEYELWICGLG